MQTIPRTAGLIVVALVVGLAVVLPRVGNTTVRPGADGVLELVIEGFAIEPAEFTVLAAEPVTLVFVNRSQTTYHLAFGREVVQEAGQPARFAEDLLAGVDARVEPPSAWIPPTPSVPTVTLDVRAGSTVRLGLTVPPDRVGVWHVGCFVGPGCDPQVSLAAQLTVE
jgi:hypothetical protein